MLVCCSPVCRLITRIYCIKQRTLSTVLENDVTIPFYTAASIIMFAFFLSAASLSQIYTKAYTHTGSLAKKPKAIYTLNRKTVQNLISRFTCVWQAFTAMWCTFFSRAINYIVVIIFIIWHWLLFTLNINSKKWKLHLVWMWRVGFIPFPCIWSFCDFRVQCAFFICNINDFKIVNPYTLNLSILTSSFNCIRSAFVAKYFRWQIE